MMDSKEKGWVNSHFLNWEHTGWWSQWRLTFICVAHPDVRFAAVRFCFWALRFREREGYLCPDLQGICEKRGGRKSVSMVMIVFLKWVLVVKGFTNLTRALQILELPDKLQYKFWIRAESVRPGSFWWSVCSKPQEILWNSKVGVWGVGEKLGRWGQDCWGSGVSARVSHLCWAWAEAPAALGLEVAGKVTCYFLF